MTITEFRNEYRFLSNFYPTKVELDGVTYPSVEHAFQAAKTYNKVVREQIRCCEKPAMAKRIGRTIPLREDWEEVKIAIMTGLVFQKFMKHPELAGKLLATGDEELVEGNWWGDTFWGVYKGKGQNHLGKILMQAREVVR